MWPQQRPGGNPRGGGSLSLLILGGAALRGGGAVRRVRAVGEVQALDVVDELVHQPDRKRRARGPQRPQRAKQGARWPRAHVPSSRARAGTRPDALKRRVFANTSAPK